jgi:preprotein translocase subunit SecE
VAKDRKRPQGRRKRPSKPARPLDEQAREAGLSDDSVEDAGLGDPSTPNELRGATPYADEARLAEAGVDVPAPDDEDDMERAPDELERDLAPARAAIHDDELAARGPRRERGRVLTFFGHCVDELRRVQWPNRRQVGQATAVVLGFVVLAGGYLGLMDAIWRPIVNAII